jgi:hypothetical protein
MNHAAAILVAALGASAGLARAQEQSDWERRNIGPAFSEQLAVPPAAPNDATLIEFRVDEAPGVRFFIDGATLDVGSDGVVRYVLVARSSAGAQNVSYEGLRCGTGQYRRYAVGRSNGSWGRVEENWRAWPRNQRWLSVLQRDYFCPQTQAIRTAAEGIHALENGGHPFARGLGSLPYGH